MIVYIGLWSISYTPICLLVINEVKRIAFQEFIDDIALARKFKGIINIDVDEEAEE